LIAVVIILCIGFIVLNIIPRAIRIEHLETSIAVLPFENKSDDSSYSHIGGAFTDEIIMELQKIKAFSRVLSRTSTMQYEEDRPTIPEIAEKLNVNYIIEGSIQGMKGRVRIRDEPEFQQIVDDVEAKCQSEHERVWQWLEENDML
jgi:TolB-like protein